MERDERRGRGGIGGAETRERGKVEGGEGGGSRLGDHKEYSALGGRVTGGIDRGVTPPPLSLYVILDTE